MQIFIILVVLAVVVGIVALSIWSNHKENKRRRAYRDEQFRESMARYNARQEELEFEEKASRKKGGYYYPNKFSSAEREPGPNYVPLIPLGTETLLLNHSRDEIVEPELPAFLASVPDPTPGSDCNPYPVESHRYEPPATVEPARTSSDDDLTRNSSWLGGGGSSGGGGASYSWDSADTASSHSSTSSYLPSDTFTTSSDSCTASDTSSFSSDSSSSFSWSSND